MFATTPVIYIVYSIVYSRKSFLINSLMNFNEILHLIENNTNLKNDLKYARTIEAVITILADYNINITADELSSLYKSNDVTTNGTGNGCIGRSLLFKNYQQDLIYL